MCIAAAIGGAAILGAGASVYGADKAASAQKKASKSAIAEQQRQYDLTRADQAPWLAAGKNALAKLSDPLKNFQASPDYNFVRGEGQRGIGNSFAAEGGAFSGNALRALTQYNQNLAQGQFGNWWNQQAGLAGVGQTAATNLGQFGANAANNTSNALMNAGDARASGIIGSTNALTGALSNGVNQWLYFRKPPGVSGGGGGGGGANYGGGRF